ncbi:hypothetical protein DJ94_4357 [Bacillus pseudomycoides]|nr:hypothetical protein DJ94_4357 [Bacillus pseudomycoides]
MKFIYIGGEAPVLEPYIRLALLDHMSESAAKNKHFFLNDIIQNSEKEVFAPTSRTINLAALELKTIDEMKGRADNMPDDVYKILNEKANSR